MNTAGIKAIRNGHDANRMPAVMRLISSTRKKRVLRFGRLHERGDAESCSKSSKQPKNAASSSLCKLRKGFERQTVRRSRLYAAKKLIKLRAVYEFLSER